MKTRIVILLSFVLFFVSCSKDAPLDLSPSDGPEITMSSPNPQTIYAAGSTVLISGEINDLQAIKSLSIIVYKNTTTVTDTAYFKTRVVDANTVSFSETWTPQATDFAGSLNNYLLEVKVTHDANSTSPSQSYFQEIQVNK